MVGSRHRPEKEAAAELRPQLGLTANGRQRRRRLPLARRPVGFSPFFRSLSCRLLRRISTRSASDHAGLTPPLRSSTSPPPPPPAESTSEEEEEEEESDIMDENDDDDKEEEDAVEATVQVDFGFFDPKPGDFHGVKLLLRSYLGDREWDLSGFVDLILDQTTVGTVVKSENPEGEEQEEGEEEEAAAAGDGGEADEAEDVGPYAVITALNLGRYGTHQCIKELKNYILEACCEDPVKKKKLELMLGGKGAHDVGLLVCERFVNFPHQPVSPLYEGLFDEVSWATEDEPTQELRDSFRFKSYLILTRIFMRKDADLRGRSQISSGKKSKGRGSDDDEPIIYVKAEDEIFLKLCSLSFSFDLPRKEQVVPPELKGYKEMGLLMVIESSRVPAFREELKSFLLED